MDDVQKAKADLRDEMAATLGKLSEKERRNKTGEIENRLFDFANFLESKIALLYLSTDYDVSSENIIRRTYGFNKIIVLPLTETKGRDMKLYKVDDFNNDITRSAGGARQPDPLKCKQVPIDCIDIAVVPGLAFDEKGGRIGCGDGFYDRLIPDLPITTRKVALAFDSQIVPQIPVESHDKFVDIIITEKRIIYKI